jgi:hypothetical protein
METAKIYFECEKCGQPFDIEINSREFKYIETYEQGNNCRRIYEFKSQSHCCGKDIDIKIHVIEYPVGGYDQHEISYKGLRNLRTDANFNSIIKEVFRNHA